MRHAYEVGDTVVVRTDLDTYARYRMADHDFDDAGCHAVSDMLQYGGCAVKITEVYRNASNRTRYRIDADGGFWAWVDEMFDCDDREYDIDLSELF